MTRIGTLTRAYRYPIKSMQGESLDEATLGVLGIEGDRRWGVRDESRGDFMTGKRVAALMGCRARLVAGAAPEVELPDGHRFAADAPEANARLSEALGRKVTLWPIGSAPPPGAEAERDSEEELAAMMAREEGEPAPDFSNIPEALLAFAARPDRPYFDLSPLLLLTEQSLATLAKAASDAQVDVRRFRPSLLVDATEAGDFPEQGWLGKRLRIGGAVIRVEMPCVRCVMTTHGFAELPEAPRIMRSLVSEAAGNLGVYASIERGGSLLAGDAVEAID